MTLSDSIRKDRTSLQERKDAMRDKINADIDAFFGAGNSIKQIPNGASALNEVGQTMSMKDYWAAQTKIDNEVKK